MITHRARAMRKAMTEPEVILWNRLRGRRGDRPTFRRPLVERPQEVAA